MTELSSSPELPAAPLLHICSRSEWKAAQERGEIVAPSLSAEGFIHCSFAGQVLIPANQRFHGRTDLVLLDLDPNKIEHSIIVEDSYASGHSFPHVYGPIPVDSVSRIIEFPCDPFGEFTLPIEFQ